MTEALNLFGAGFTFLFGIGACLQPMKVSKLIALTPFGERGVSEIRATYGGWMLGLSGFALWVQSPLVFQCLAAGWLGAAVFRTISFAVDKSYSPRNLRFVIIEIIIGIFLLV